ncbi:MAG: hypothetical protein HYW77_02915 [Parcubacteria group bacterium]|nr:hypothetical protein [Parcubacteria group bacterium]
MRKGISLIFLVVLFMALVNFGFVSAQDSSQYQYVEPLSAVKLECSLEDKAQQITFSGPSLCANFLNPSPAVSSNGRLVVASVYGEGSQLGKAVAINFSDGNLSVWNQYLIDSSSIFPGLVVTEVTLKEKNGNLFLLVIGTDTFGSSGKAYLLKSTDNGDSFSVLQTLMTKNMPFSFSDMVVQGQYLVITFRSPGFFGDTTIDAIDLFFSSDGGGSFDQRTLGGPKGGYFTTPKLQSAGSKLYLFSPYVNKVSYEALLVSRYSENGGKDLIGAGWPNIRYAGLFGQVGSKDVRGWITTAYSDHILYAAYPVRTESGGFQTYFVSKKDGQNGTLPQRLSDSQDSSLLPAISASNGKVLAIFYRQQEDTLNWRVFGTFINQQGKMTQDFPVGDLWQLDTACGSGIGLKAALESYKNEFVAIWPQEHGLFARIKK